MYKKYVHVEVGWYALIIIPSDSHTILVGQITVATILLTAKEFQKYPEN